MYFFFGYLILPSNTGFTGLLINEKMKIYPKLLNGEKIKIRLLTKNSNDKIFWTKLDAKL